MVCADLECLVSPHDQPGLVVVLVLQQTHVARAALLPLLGLAVKLEELCPHLECLLLLLLVCRSLDLFRKADDGLELGVFSLLNLLLVLSSR